jgi:hypothetical protein
VWNWEHQTWGVRDLPSNTAYIEGGVVDTQDTTDIWTLSDGTWADWTTEWGSLGFTPQKSSPALASVVISKGDVTNQFAGTSFTSNICRTDIPLGEQDNFVRVKAVYPRLRGSTVDINIGVQQAPEGTIKWNGFKSFTPGTDQKIDVRLTGTHLAIKVQSDGDDSWEMSGIDIEFEPIYRR